MPDVPLEIVCVDCGGRAHLLTILDDEPVETGDVIAYRCEDCMDRWDIVMTDDDDGHGDRPDGRDDWTGS